MQRRSTPHLVTARDRVIREGRLGTIGLVEIYCYYHMRATSNPPDTAPPETFDYEMWTGPAPMRPYNALVHPRRWRAFMEYGNGIVGDMCVHMLDMTRWMLDLGYPKRVSSSGGIFVDKASKANITDTHTRRPSEQARVGARGREGRRATAPRRGPPPPPHPPPHRAAWPPPPRPHHPPPPSAPPPFPPPLLPPLTKNKKPPTPPLPPN